MSSSITVFSLGFQAYLLLALEWPCYFIYEPSGIIVEPPRPYLPEQHPLAAPGGRRWFPRIPLLSPLPARVLIASPTRELAGGISHITNRAL